MRLRRLKGISKIKLKRVIAIVVGLILLVAIYLNTFLIMKYNILPLKFLIIYFILVGLIPFIMIFFTVFRHIKNLPRFFLTFFQVCYIVVLFFVFSYFNNTINFLDETTSSYDYETKNYYVIALKESNLKSIDDLKNTKIGLTSNLDNNISKALKELKGKAKIQETEYSDFTTLFDALYNKEVEGMLISDSFYNMFNEESNLDEKINIVYKFAIKEEIEKLGVDVDVTKETFNVYISGMDSYGSVTDKTRSDVNIVATINPKTNQVLMVNIPRDYYVELHGINGKDKLTHAGIYGVEMSMKTIEDLLDIKINYYVKVNYNALIKLVNTLDGVDVYSTNNFTSGVGYRFKEGYNHVNGDQALEFVRTRKAFTDGDRQRGENQQAMISAIINKAMSPSILVKYNEILESLSGSFTTNISTNKIMSLVNMQLDKMPKWSINSISLNGSDSSDYTYTYPHQQLYVMIPDEETIASAKQAIQNIY